MKLKSIVMAGLVAASCAYIAPVLANDATNNNADPSSSNTTSSNDMASAGQHDTNVGNSGMDSMTPSSSDQPTPDTATGDDDY